MMSKIEEFLRNSTDKTSRIFLRKNASYGNLSVTNCYLHTQDTPNSIEKVIADTALLFGVISRIEISLITGLSLPVIDFELERMSIEGYLIHVDNFNKNKLQKNIKEIKKDLQNRIISEDNYFELNRLLESYYIKQYKLTENGINLSKKNQKNSIEFREELDCSMVIIDEKFWSIGEKDESKFLTGGQKTSIGPEFYPSIELFLQNNSKTILETYLSFNSLSETSIISLYENRNCVMWIGENNNLQPSFLISNGTKTISYNTEISPNFPIRTLKNLFKQQIIDKLILDHKIKLKIDENTFFKFKENVNDDNSKLGCLLKLELYNEEFIDYISEIKPHYFRNLISDDIELDYLDDIYLTRYQFLPYPKNKKACLSFCYHHLKEKRSTVWIVNYDDLFYECKSTIDIINGLSEVALSIDSRELLEYVLKREKESPIRKIYLYEDEVKIDVESYLSELGIESTIELSNKEGPIKAVCTITKGFEKVRQENIKKSSFLERGSTKANYQLILIPELNANSKLYYISGLISTLLNEKIISKKSLLDLVIKKDQELENLLFEINQKSTKLEKDFYEKLIIFLRKNIKINFFIVEEEIDKIITYMIAKGFENLAKIEFLSVNDNYVKTVISIKNDLFEKYGIEKLPNILENSIITQSFDNYPNDQNIQIEFKFIIKDGNKSNITKLLAMRLGGKFKNEITTYKNISDFYSKEIRDLQSISKESNIIISEDLVSQITWNDCLKLAKTKYKILIKEEEIIRNIRALLPDVPEKNIFVQETNNILTANILLSKNILIANKTMNEIQKNTNEMNIEFDNKKFDFKCFLKIHPQDKDSLEILTYIRAIKIFENKIMSIQNGINTIKSLAGDFYQKAIEFAPNIEKFDFDNITIEQNLRNFTEKKMLFIEDYIIEKISKEFQDKKILTNMLTKENLAALIIPYTEINQYYNDQFKESLLGFTEQEIITESKIKINYKFIILPELSSVKEIQFYISLIIGEKIKEKLISKEEILFVGNKEIEDLIQKMSYFKIKIEEISLSEKWLIPSLKNQFKDNILIKEEILKNRIKEIFSGILNNKNFDFIDDIVQMEINRREIDSFIKNNKESLLVLDIQFPYLDLENKKINFTIVYIVSNIKDFKELLNLRIHQISATTNKQEKMNLMNNIFDKTLHQSSLSEKDKKIIMSEKEEYLKGFLNI